MSWKSLFRKRTLETQLDSELRFHVEKLVNDYIAEGMPPEEARRKAVLEFGGREQIKEELRDVHRVRIIESSLANLKSAFRFIRKSPSFSLAVIATLALGIGANSAVFSAIDAILLRPLPFPDGDQLMRISQYQPKLKSPENFVAPVRLEDWNRMNSTFQAMTGYYSEDATETSGALPEKVTEIMVAPRFLQVWGIAPALGRDFLPEEGRFGGPNAVLISDRFWHRRYGADPAAVGKQLRMGKYSNTIVGVMPNSFLFPIGDADIWPPVPIDGPYTLSRESTWYTVIGRLKPGVRIEEARANLETVQTQLGKAFPKTDAELKVGIQPLKELMVGGVRGSLLLLYGSVSLLLLISCTNIVALLLARSTQRQHEISVRYSLGASRAAIVMQLLTEAFVMTLIGAGLGLVVANGASDAFRALASNLPRVEEIRLDWRIVQWFLVSVQVALAVTLLTGAGLLLRSFQELGRVSPGFEASHVLTFHITGSWGETADMKGLTQRIERTIEALQNVPGVAAAATSAELPGVPTDYQTELKLLEGRAESEPELVAESRFVSPGYFKTLQIPLLAGELCREGGSTLDMLVNHKFADAYFAGQTAMGHHLAIPTSTFAPPGEIRGIVGDAREIGMNREPVPTAYWCMSAPMPDPHYLVRTGTEPLAMAETLRQRIHELEPGRSVFEVMTLQERLGEAFAENRLRRVLLAFFAVTAVSLACVGLYGTLSYAVNVRRREVGLRLALGAVRGQIVKHFVWQGFGVSLLGCVAGWGLATAFGRTLSGILYGVSPMDLTTSVAVLALVLMVTTTASLVPAVRAARVEPM